MSNIEVKLSKMGLNELVACYKEIEQWNKSGILKDGAVKKLWEEYEGNIAHISVIPLLIYKEIAKRYIVNELKIEI